MYVVLLGGEIVQLVQTLQTYAIHLSNVVHTLTLFHYVRLVDILFWRSLGLFSQVKNIAYGESVVLAEVVVFQQFLDGNTSSLTDGSKIVIFLNNNEIIIVIVLYIILFFLLISGLLGVSAGAYIDSIINDIRDNI